MNNLYLALYTIHQEILKKNNGDIHAEDFYWWNAVLDIFGYRLDENGDIARTVEKR